MRYYRRKNNQKIRKIFRRLLFVLLSAAGIFGVSVAIGNHLQQKVNAVQATLESSIPPSYHAVERNDNLQAADNGEVYSTLHVSAAGLSLQAHDTDDSLVARLHTIGDGFDTVSVSLRDANGLLYTSPALLSLLHLPASSQEDPVWLRLQTVCTAAKASNLRLSGVLSCLSSLASEAEMQVSALTDSTLAAELAGQGFDEVLFTDLLSDTATTDEMNRVKRYLQTIHTSLANDGDGAAISVGAVLPYSVYMDASNAKQVQMIASTVDFLAIDCSALSVDGSSDLSLQHVCDTLAGSFQVYNLRVILAGTEPSLLAAQTEILSRLEYTNIQYFSEVSKENLYVTPAAEDDDNPEDDTSDDVSSSPETLPPVNPYALPNDTAGENESDSTGAPSDEAPVYQSGEDSWL